MMGTASIRGGPWAVMFYKWPRRGQCPGSEMLLHLEGTLWVLGSSQAPGLGSHHHVHLLTSDQKQNVLIYSYPLSRFPKHHSPFTHGTQSPSVPLCCLGAFARAVSSTWDSLLVWPAPTHPLGKASKTGPSSSLMCAHVPPCEPVGVCLFSI